MGDNLLEEVSNGTILTNQQFNELINEIIKSQKGTLFGRDENGAIVAGVDLGDGEHPFKDIYLSGSILVDNISYDLRTLFGGGENANNINTGRTRAASGQPDFLRASGTAAEVTLLASESEPFEVNFKDSSARITTNLTLSGLQLAPGTNNTVLVDDSNISGQDFTKYVGEDGGNINVGTAGSEITSRIDEFAAFKSVNELAIGNIKSDTELTNLYRGFFFDSSGEPIIRETLTDGQTLTLMSLAWIFIDGSGTSLNATYNTPKYSYDEPSAPIAGDYYFDLQRGEWRRYSGSAWEGSEEGLNRMLIGVAVIDSTNCIATRSFDFARAFAKNENLPTFEIKTTEKVASNEKINNFNVYGATVKPRFTALEFDITTDLVSPLIEAADTTYYCYIDNQLQKFIDIERPYNRRDLLGFYHPYHNWLCVAKFENDSGSDIVNVSKPTAQVGDSDIIDVSGVWVKPLGAKTFSVTIIGGGGGGSVNVVIGVTGGTSSFGNIMNATGGTGGGVGGVGSGGDINLSGGDSNKTISATLNSTIQGAISKFNNNYYGAGGAATALGGSFDIIGGGGGGIAEKILNSSDVGSVQNITVGAGGSGAVPAFQGKDGVCIVKIIEVD